MSEAFIQVSVRLLVGLICAAIGAFFGALIIAMVFSAIDSSSAAVSTARIVFVAITAAGASRIGWFGVAETRAQSLGLFASSVLTAVAGSLLALVVAGSFLEHSDLYILNRDISGAGFFGGVFASNIPSLVFTAQLARRREI